MRDLVETVIGQVLKRQPTMNHAAKSASQQPTAAANKMFKNVHVEQPVEIKDEKMWKVSRQFEAIFLQQMMQAMRATVSESKAHPKSYANHMYDDMLDQAISQSGSKQAPLGLAMNIYKQLQREAGSQAINNASQIQDAQHIADTLKNNATHNPPQLGGING